MSFPAVRERKLYSRLSQFRNLNTSSVYVYLGDSGLWVKDLARLEEYCLGNLPRNTPTWNLQNSRP